MSYRVEQCYDRLAANFHLIFKDWEASMRRQAAAVGPILERACARAGRLRILDCACGIGTQTLGLAQRGHALVGVDLSEAAVSRARREAEARSLSIQFEVADMRDLSSLSATEFDVVLAADNAIPHSLN